jgi:hypothetical protein
MKKGQIILGAAAFIVTAASVLAFRAHNKSSGNRLYGLTDVNNPSSCTVSTCFTQAFGTNPPNCHTGNAGVRTVHTAAGGGSTWWTGKTAANYRCTGAAHGNWTHSS